MNPQKIAKQVSTTGLEKTDFIDFLNEAVQQRKELLELQAPTLSRSTKIEQDLLLSRIQLFITQLEKEVI